MAGTPNPTAVGHEGARVAITERTAWSINGFLGLLVGLALVIVAIMLFTMTGADQESATPASEASGVLIGVAVFCVLLGALILSSLTVVAPGTTRVVQFFGRYVGTVRTTGLIMTVPLSTRKRVSVRVSNFETNELKVNDADGNPVNIASIVVWQVADTAKAVFAVEDYNDFIHVQAESALRHVAMSHPYDHADAGESTLRGATDVVSSEIAHEVAARVAIAGIEVIEARISNLAYAAEIAQAMLQRQQAGAIIAARELIVEGAVTMVESALTRLEDENVVILDDERKAAMVSNLLVVLCGDSRATPVVNTGTLY